MTDSLAPGTGEHDDDAAVVRRPLPIQIVERLREQILRAEWAPGERLPEQALCARFGVSRTPLREAFKILQSEGLLALSPNRGAVVTQPTTADTEEKLRVLGALEALAIELACDNASDLEMAQIQALHADMMLAYAKQDAAGYFRLNTQVHRAIVEASGNRTLADLHAMVVRHVQRARHLANARMELSEPSKQEHEALIMALSRRDARAARAAMDLHMADIARRIQGAFD